MTKFTKNVQIAYQFALLAPMTLAMGAYMVFARRGMFQQYF